MLSQLECLACRHSSPRPALPRKFMRRLPSEEVSPRRIADGCRLAAISQWWSSYREHEWRPLLCYIFKATSLSPGILTTPRGSAVRRGFSKSCMAVMAPERAAVYQGPVLVWASLMPPLPSSLVPSVLRQWPGAWTVIWGSFAQRAFH